MQFSLELDEPADCLVTIRHGLQAKESGDGFDYSIDADFFTTRKREGADVLGILDQFNRQDGNFFRWAIRNDLFKCSGPSLSVSASQERTLFQCPDGSAFGWETTDVPGVIGYFGWISGKSKQDLERVMCYWLVSMMPASGLPEAMSTLQEIRDFHLQRDELEARRLAAPPAQPQPARVVAITERPDFRLPE